MGISVSLAVEMLRFYCCFLFPGMCPDKSNANNMNGLSTVEDLSDPIPGLFDVLTEEPDPELRWTTHTYPAHLDLVYFRPNRHGQNLDLSGGELYPQFVAACYVEISTGMCFCWSSK